MHSPRQRTLRAYAKTNLLLRILAREASGYHGIETVFQRLALHDLVHVSLESSTRTLACDGPAMPAGGLGVPHQNLAWRAAEAYAGATGWATGWHIAIEKRIPVGGGLGGGSADAAAVLRAMNAMSPTPLPPEELLVLAGVLGADVPFLAANLPRAIAWGRGDRLLALGALPPMQVELFTFPVGVNTGAAYGAFARLREEGPGRFTGVAPVHARAYDVDALASWDALAAVAANDFEHVVPSLHTGVAATLPVLREAAAAMRARGVPAIAMLSGSGATCVLLHPADEASGVADDALPPETARVVTTTA